MKTKMNKLDPAGISIAADNIAWAVANKAAWQIIGAAKLQHADNVQAVERPKFENTMLVDGVREHLTIAANLVNGAEIDGIDTNLIERELEKQLAGAFLIDAKQLKRIDNTDYSEPAVTELVNEMGVQFIELSDAEQADLVAKRQVRMRSEAKKSLIIACDVRKEYRDICDYFARCITNAPDAANAISGNQDVSDYLEARESAVITRLKSLRQNSTMVDGEWKNRYDRNGHANESVISELNGHFTILLEEAIKVGIDVSAIEALPTQADVTAIVAKLKAS
jgi:hypothetical protein